MMNKKSLVLLIFGIFIIIFIVPQIIHFLVYTPSPFGFIKPGEESQWIGFFGSVIGGSLTLAGVWWTLKYQDKKRKEDLAVQYRPIISIDVSLHEIDKNDEHGLVLKIDEYNIGRGEAINVCGKMYDNNQLIATLNPAPFIPSNMNKTISETLLDVIFDYTNIPSHQLFIEITYTDLYGIYQYKFTSRIDIFYDRFKSDNPAIVTSDKRIDVERI